MTVERFASLSSILPTVDDTTASKTGAIGPGLVAFLIVVALGLATFLLIRSMLNQIKKVPPTFDGPPTEGSTGTKDSTPEPPEAGRGD